MEAKEIMLDAISIDMENMEIDVNSIEKALMPELPAGVSEFLARAVDKPY